MGRGDRLTGSSAAAPADAAAGGIGAGGWWVPVSASVRGGAHVRRGAPNEDAAAVSVPGPTACVAVADGHGDRSCPRAARGARFAVETARELLGAVDHAALSADPLGVAETVRATVVEPLVDRWRVRVWEDVAADAFNAEELALMPGGVDGGPLTDTAVAHAYGTTLLAAAAGQVWLILVQVGDGEVGVGYASGSARQPIPDDGAYAGQFTASLASPQAAAHIRVSAVPVSSPDPVAAVWACTDGFSGAQADPRWRDLVAQQLVATLAGYGPAEVARRLPGWLGPAAHTAGDDTTMAILLAGHSGQQNPPRSRPAGTALGAGEDSTLAATRTLDPEQPKQLRRPRWPRRPAPRTSDPY
jgi:hypothetical protein